jgi:hypothetical protein
VCARIYVLYGVSRKYGIVGETSCKNFTLAVSVTPLIVWPSKVEHTQIVACVSDVILGTFNTCCGQKTHSHKLAYDFRTTGHSVYRICTITRLAD